MRSEWPPGQCTLVTNFCTAIHTHELSTRSCTCTQQPCPACLQFVAWHTTMHLCIVSISSTTSCTISTSTCTLAHFEFVFKFLYKPFQRQQCQIVCCYTSWAQAHGATLCMCRYTNRHVQLKSPQRFTLVVLSSAVASWTSGVFSGGSIFFQHGFYSVYERVLTQFLISRAKFEISLDTCVRFNREQQLGVARWQSLMLATPKESLASCTQYISTCSTVERFTI